MTDKIVFPSSAWFDSYQDGINADDELAEDWGVDFNGDFVFTMTDMPVDDLDRDAMPDELDEEIDAYIHETDSDGYTGHAYVALEAGNCDDARLIEDPSEVDYGFVLRGTYDTWVDLIKGNVGAVDGMMSGQFELEGDMQKVLQYTDSATRLTDIAGGVDAVFAHEEF